MKTTNNTIQIFKDKYELTPDELTTLCQGQHRKNTILAFTQLYETLLTLGLHKKLILKITSGVKNAASSLAAIKNFYQNIPKALIDPTSQKCIFSTDDIVRLVMHNNPALMLEALINFYQNIPEKLIDPITQKCIFSTNDIVRMMNHNGGYLALASVRNFYQKIPNDLIDEQTKKCILSPAKIVDIVRYSGGSHNLDALLNFYQNIPIKLIDEQTKQCIFRPDEIVKIVSNSTSSKKLDFLAMNFIELEKSGLSKENIINIIAKTRNIETVFKTQLPNVNNDNIPFDSLKLNSLEEEFWKNTEIESNKQIISEYSLNENSERNDTNNKIEEYNKINFFKKKSEEPSSIRDTNPRIHYNIFNPNSEEHDTNNKIDNKNSDPFEINFRNSPPIEN